MVGGCRADNLPVMVWVTGGGYIFGAGSEYDPQDLIMHGPVVVVTVNYRLGPIGFLSTGRVAILSLYLSFSVSH
jgi:carboxylesterase type B